MKDFRIALVQYSPVVDESPKLNIQLFERNLEPAIANGTQILNNFRSIPGYALRMKSPEIYGLFTDMLYRWDNS